jgi:hypothetical protein
MLNQKTDNNKFSTNYNNTYELWLFNTIKLLPYYKK